MNNDVETETETSPAEIIRQQLGRQALMMLGAQNLYSFDGGAGLQFDIRGSRKVNRIRIKLDASDTYTVSFWKISARAAVASKEVASYSDVYVDSLHQIIESATGIYTSPQARR